MCIEFVLPYPPTVNTYWRRRGLDNIVRGQLVPGGRLGIKIKITELECA